MNMRSAEISLETKIFRLFLQHWQCLPEPKPLYEAWFYGSGLQEAITYIISTASSLAKQERPNIAEVFDIAPPAVFVECARELDDLPF